MRAAQYSGTNGDLISLLTAYADRVLDRASDHYGPSPSGLLVDALDPQTGEPLCWQGHIISNFASQQNFLRLLDGLTVLTGQPRYRERALALSRAALGRLAHEESGLLVWGGHSAFDLATGHALVGLHELKCHYPYYELLHEANPSIMERFISAAWERHVWNWSSLLFNRHGEYLLPKGGRPSPAWNGEFQEHGPAFFIENRALSFINTGSDLIVAAAVLSKWTRDPAPLTWAYRLLGRYEAIRHPETGLAGYQFNYREPCRVRSSFNPPWNAREDVNEATIVERKVILGRYGRVAIALLNLSEELDAGAGRPFREFVVHDLKVLSAHLYDNDSGLFQPSLIDGTSLDPAYVEDTHGYFRPTNLTPASPNGMLFLAYAKAYRLTREPDFLAMALNMARGIGWSIRGDGSGFEILSDTPPPLRREVLHGNPEWIDRNQGQTCQLFGWLELHSATGDAATLHAADLLAGQLLAAYHRQGWFFDVTVGQSDEPWGYYGENGRFASINNGLPLALTSLAAVRNGLPMELFPAYAPNCSFFDPKIFVQNGNLL